MREAAMWCSPGPQRKLTDGGMSTPRPATFADLNARPISPETDAPGRKKTRKSPAGVSTNQLVFTAHRGTNGDVFRQRYLYTATCDKDPRVGIQA